VGGVNSVSSEVGCSPQCLTEIKTQDGDLQRRVEQLVKEKVRDGEYICLLVVHCLLCISQFILSALTISILLHSYEINMFFSLYLLLYCFNSQTYHQN